MYDNIDPGRLRREVRSKYRHVALQPGRGFDFYTGRPLAERLGYRRPVVGALPDRAVESFAGIGNPFALRPPQPGENVLDVGCGAGFDAFVAAAQVGPAGQVIGIDMTPEMVAKAQATARALGLRHVEFREGFAESLPVGDGWADVVISNGTINLCPDKRTVFAEIHRVLRAGGALQFADVANGNPVPPEALRDIDLWAAWLTGGLPRASWQKMLQDSGFTNITIGPGVDTFGRHPRRRTSPRLRRVRLHVPRLQKGRAATVVGQERTLSPPATAIYQLPPVDRTKRAYHGGAAACWARTFGMP
jgi:arsenite methyltransferase